MNSYYNCDHCGVKRTLTKKSKQFPEGAPRICQSCKSGHPQYWEHGKSSTYARGCRCEDCKSFVYAYNRARGAGGYKRPPSSRYEKVCGNPECGITFTTGDKRKVVCSDACSYRKRQLDYADRREAKRLARMTVVPYDPAFAPEQRAQSLGYSRLAHGVMTVVKSTGGVFYSGSCAWCGDQFTRKSWSDATQCCSRRCSAKRIKVMSPTGRAQFKYWITVSRRRSIYERDAYVCQVCGVRCLAEYVWGDPLSPTLDHIVPRSCLGDSEPRLHADWNLRTCCAQCNTWRQTEWSRAQWTTLMCLAGLISEDKANAIRVANVRSA